MTVYLIKGNLRKKMFAAFKATGKVTQFTGLMFQTKVAVPLLFKANGFIAIHSFFCPEFDAVFLNAKRKIVKAQAVEPWTKRLACKAFFLFEFPPGTIKRFKLKKGDELQWSGK